MPIPPEKDPQRFEPDAAVAAVDGWEIGIYPEDGELAEDKNFMPTPQLAARHQESGHVYVMSMLVNRQTKEAGTPYVRILTGVEGEQEERAAQAQAKEAFSDAPPELHEALISKARQLEGEYGLSSMAEQMAHYLLETRGVEQRYINPHTYSKAVEITADGREWEVIPYFYRTFDDSEIRFVPAVLDKKTGEPVTVLSPLPDGPAQTGSNYMIHGAGLEELPSPVRGALGDLMLEMAERFHVRVKDGVYDNIVGVNALPTTDEISSGLDAMLETTVTPLAGHMAPYLSSSLVKADETTWAVSARCVSSPVSAFSLRPVIANMDTGEVYSLKAADMRPMHDPIRRRQVNGVTEVICEQLEPERQEIPLSEFCERVPAQVRSYASACFSEIGDRLDMHFAPDLREKLYMPNGREARDRLADDDAIAKTVSHWTAQFSAEGGSKSERVARERKDGQDPEGPSR